MSERSHRPSVSRLRTLFNLVDGRLLWAIKPRWSPRQVGDEAGWFSNGYVIVRIDGRDYRAHRVIWAIVNGKWPSNEIDHINGVTSDNRPENLRDATHSENMRNRGRTRANKSGFKGVSWCKAANKWRAAIKVKNKCHHLGVFVHAEDAANAYVVAAKQFHAGFTDRLAAIPAN